VILAGDVGATKTMLGLFASDNSRPTLVRRQTFHSAAYAGLTPIVREFLQGGEPVEMASFGVAGPVIGDSAEVTNLSWKVEAKALAEDLGIEDVCLVNDLVATGYGIGSLTEEDFMVVNQGQPVAGANAALIAAGSGLGECTLYWDGCRYVPLPAEAGHADFAPYDDTSLELLRYLRHRTSSVGIEHIISGPGLLNIYDFLRDSTNLRETPEIVDRMRQSDRAAVIAQAAMAGECQLCVRTLCIFVSAYGAEAGNLALRSLALGGVYVAGGIARKILPWMTQGAFMAAFANKDRQAAMLSRIPVRVVLNEAAPLFGAVTYLLQRK